MIDPSELFSSQSHSFNQGVACHLGLEAAAVLSHIIYLLKLKDVEKRDRKCWLHKTQKEIADSLKYLSEDQVQRSIKKLVGCGILIKGSFNLDPFDRTNWYCLFDEVILRDYAYCEVVQ